MSNLGENLIAALKSFRDGLKEQGPAYIDTLTVTTARVCTGCQTQALMTRICGDQYRCGNCGTIADFGAEKP